MLHCAAPAQDSGSESDGAQLDCGLGFRLTAIHGKLFVADSQAGLLRVIPERTSSGPDRAQFGRAKTRISAIAQAIQGRGIVPLVAGPA